MGTWTKEELQTLEMLYSKINMDELKKLLPNKTALAIYKRAYILGMRQSKEIEFANRSNAHKGEKCPNWKGGVTTTSKGYRLIKCPEHERANSKGYVLEHILVFEKETGIKVPPECCIHHLNGNKQDNRIENLCMMTHAAHTKMHSSGSKLPEEAKLKISQKAKERFKNKSNHPAYKEIDVKALKQMRDNGATISEICQKFKICKYTYYKKLEELK